MRARTLFRLAPLAPVLGLVVLLATGPSREAVARVPPFDTIDTIVGSEHTPTPALQPFGLSVVAGEAGPRVLVSDPVNHVIRAFDLAEGCDPSYGGVFAGTAVAAAGGDGSPLARAELNGPYDVTEGSAAGGFRYFYVADTFAHRIRVIAQPVGSEAARPATIATLAGSSTFGFSGDGDIASNATLNSPYGVAWDASRRALYIADTLNHRIRRVDLARSRVSGAISTVAGAGAAGYAGDGGPATSALLNRPRGLAVGPNGLLYIADTGNNVVRTYNPSTRTISTVAGTGTAGYAGDGGIASSAMLNRPADVALDAANGVLYIADTGNHIVRRRDRSGIITTVAGDRRARFAGDDGPATAASLSSPFAVTFVPRCGLLVGDTANNRIRRVDLSASPPSISSVAGNGTPSFDGEGRGASEVELAGPAAVAQWSYTCSGELSSTSAKATFILDTFSHSVRYLYESGEVSEVRTLVGDGLPAGAGPTPAGITRLSTPMGMAMREVSSSPAEIDLFVADTLANVVRRINWRPCPTSSAPTAGEGPAPGLSVVAGTGVGGYNGDDNPATESELMFPMGVAVDERGGSLFVADSYNNRIRRVVLASGDISTTAGTGLSGFVGDGGPPETARLHFPYGVAVQGSSLYVSDSFNNRIRLVAPSNLGTSVISTRIGDGIAGYNGDLLPAARTRLARPWGIALSDSSLFVADFLNDVVREYGLDSVRLDTVAGTGIPGLIGDPGPVFSARINAPRGLWSRPFEGRFLVADTFNNRIRRVGTPTMLIEPGRWDQTVDGPSEQEFVLRNTGSGVLPVDRIELRDPSRRFSVPTGDDRCSRGRILPAESCRFLVRFSGERGPAARAVARIHGRATNLPHDVPLRINTYGIIGGTKFDDRDGNTRRDVFEPGLPGWVIHLFGTDDRGNEVHVHSTTGSTGVYRFDVPPGRYTVCETAQSGWDPSVETGADCSSHTHDGPPNPRGVEIELPSGASRPAENLGSFRPVIVRGVVYQDGANGNPVNGRRESGTVGPLGIGGEPGIPDWTVHLIGRDGAGRLVHKHAGTLRNIPETVADESGTYAFPARPGTYTVCETLDPAYEQTQPNAGAACARLDGGSVAPRGYAVPAAMSGAEVVGEFGNRPLPGPNVSILGGGRVNEIGSDHTFTVRLTRAEGTSSAMVVGQTVKLSLDPGRSDARFTSVNGEPRSGTSADCVTVADEPVTIGVNEEGTCEATIIASRAGTATLSATWQGQGDSGQVTRTISATKRFVDFDLRILPRQGTSELGPASEFTVMLLRDVGNGFRPFAGQAVSLVLDPGSTGARFGSVNGAGSSGRQATCVTRGDRAGTAENERGTCAVSVPAASAGNLRITGTYLTELDSGGLTRTATATRHLVDLRMTIAPRESLSLIGSRQTFTVRLTRNDGSGPRGFAGNTIRLALTSSATDAHFTSVDGAPASGRSAGCVTSADDSRTPVDEAGLCRITITASRGGTAALHGTWHGRLSVGSVTRRVSAITTFVRILVTTSSCPDDTSPRGGTVDHDVTFAVVGSSLRNATVTDTLPPSMDLVGATRIAGVSPRVTSSSGGASVVWRFPSLRPGTYRGSVQSRVRDDARLDAKARNVVTLDADGLARQRALHDITIRQNPTVGGRAFGVAAARSSQALIAPTPDSDATNPGEQLSLDDPFGGSTPLAAAFTVGESNDSGPSSAAYSAIARAADVNLTIPGVLRLQAASVVANSSSRATAHRAESTRGGSFIQDLRVNGQKIGDVFEPVTLLVRDPLTRAVVAEVHLLESVPRDAAAGLAQPGADERFASGLSVLGIHVVANGPIPADVVVSRADSAASFPSGLGCERPIPRLSAAANALTVQTHPVGSPAPTPAAAPVRVAQVGLPATGGKDDAAAAVVKVPGVVAAVAAEAHTVGEISSVRDRTTGIASSWARIKDFDLFDGTLKASMVTARSQSASAVAPAGSTTIAHLEIGGADVCEALGMASECNPAPNTEILLPGGPTLLVLNEQVLERGGIAVNALHIWVFGKENPFGLPAGAEIVVAGTRAAVDPSAVVIPARARAIDVPALTSNRRASSRTGGVRPGEAIRSTAPRSGRILP